MNMEVDDELVADALLATGLRTERQVVELGLRTLLRLREQASLKRLRGNIDWQGDLESTRLDN